MRGRWGTESEIESETERKAVSGDLQTDSFCLETEGEAETAQDLIRALMAFVETGQWLTSDWQPLWLDNRH